MVYIDFPWPKGAMVLGELNHKLQCDQAQQ